MAIYRYSPQSIDSLTRSMRRRHTAGFLIFTAALCAAGARLELRAALTFDAFVSLVMVVVWVSGRHKARERMANLLRSTEIEIDEEKASWRNTRHKMSIYRSEIVEACFSKSGIWLLSKSRRGRIQFPPEIDGFDKLPNLLEDWLPSHVIRRSSPPSSVWAYLRLYGIWAGAALLLYTAMVSNTRLIGVPACLLTAMGIGWYFAWCGRKTNKRMWKVLLPLTGYLAAAVLLGKAFTLLVIR